MDTYRIVKFKDGVILPTLKGNEYFKEDPKEITKFKGSHLEAINFCRSSIVLLLSSTM